ncbi:zinc finger, CCHC-type containing protein, partial [Tanacetum coccineum]
MTDQTWNNTMNFLVYLEDFKHTLKHLKEELTLVELGSHLRIEESLRVQDSDKPKSNNVVGPQLNIVNNIGKSAFMSTFKLNDSIIWYVRLGNVYFNNKMQDMSKDGLILVLTWTLKNVKHENDDFGADLYLLHNKDEALDKLKVFKTEFELQQGSLIKRLRIDRGGFSGCRAVVRLLDPKLKTLGERGIECIFVGYAEHFNAFRFYVIEPNDSVAINLIIKLKDAIFDENRFSSVPRPSLNIPKGTKDIGGSVFPEVVTDEVVQQYEFELRKSKRNRTPKDFGPEFQLYLIEGTKDEDAAFWKEAINDEMSSIMGNNTWVLADLPPGCKPLSCKWIFKRKPKYLIAMASIHNMIIHQMDVKTAFLNGDLDEEVYMNQPQGFIMPGNENK